MKKDKFKVLLVYPNVPGSTLLPIGIASLSASLKANDIDVELFDCTFYNDASMDNFEQKKVELLQVKPFEPNWKSKGGRGDMIIDFQNKVIEYRPDLIGISLVEDTIDQGLLLLSSLKLSSASNKQIPVIAGGVGVNWNYRKIFQSGLVDYCCEGEGEEALIKLCNMLKEGIEIYRDNIPDNIGSCVHGPDFFGQHIYFGKRAKPLDINKLPFPDYSIFPEERITRVMQGKEYRMLQVEVDRGCPYQCTYCCAPALKKMYGKGYYRRKDNTKLIQELDYLVDKYKPDYIDFNSETFLARSRRSLFTFLRDYYIYFNIPFWCQGRPEDITEEKVKLLKEAGISDFQLGVEHGNEDFRKKWLKRKGSNKQIIKACNLLTQYEIPFTINMILFPNLDTRETIFDGINLCREIDSEYLKTINVYHLALYKGTQLHKYYLEQGWITQEYKTNQLIGAGSKIKYIGLNKKEIKGLQRTFPLYVKMPIEFTSNIIIAEKLDKVGDEVFKWLSKEYRERFYK